MTYVKPDIPRKSHRFACCLTGGWLFLLGPATVEAHVLVDLVRVGFPTRAHGEGVVRTGCWAPIVVDVSIENQPSFDGKLQVSQLDGDGDLACDSVEVHLLASSGGRQRYWLFVLPNTAQRGKMNIGVELLNDRGEAVTVISSGAKTLRIEPEPQPVSIHDYDLANNALILSVSVASSGRIMALEGGGDVNQFQRRIHVGHISPDELPPLWIGLEAVDYIVWDEADPADMSARQLDALVEWVRQGGTLLIGASRTAGAVAQSQALDAILPVDIGPVTRLTELGELADHLMEVDDPPRSLRPIPVARCTGRPGAFVYYRDQKLSSDLLVRGRAGRGHVVFCAVTLNDLFRNVTPSMQIDNDYDGRFAAKAQKAAVEFYRRVFYLKHVADPDLMHAGHRSVYRDIVGFISFPRDAGLYLFITIAFTVLYVLVATFGSWGFLQKKGWQHHSWSVFSLVAITACFLSVSTVETVQGYGAKVHQITVVDTRADDPYAFATALMGLKASSHAEVDVWLPSDYRTAVDPGATTCFLRPLAGENEPGEVATSYADPGRYRLVPASAVLEDVPMRATLKCMEGRWEGVLDGQVSARIAFRRGETGLLNDLRFTADSYVLNDLGVDLRQCYVLCASKGLYNPQTGEASRTSRSEDIVFALPIKDLPAGRKVMLTTRFNPTDPMKPGDERAAYDIVLSYALVEEHKRWMRTVGGLFSRRGKGPAGAIDMHLGQEQAALMLASTAGDWDAANHVPTAMGWQQYDHLAIRRGRLRHLGLREQLQGDAAVLIGFADDPGPVRLALRQGRRGYRTITPQKALTMYRVLIPLGSGGSKPAPSKKSQEQAQP